jgi:hypothetical protein
MGEEMDPSNYPGELAEMFDLASLDMQESIYADLESRPAVLMAEDFRRVEELLKGLESTAAHSLGYGAELVLMQAREHAGICRRLCDMHAEVAAATNNDTS